MIHGALWAVDTIVCGTMQVSRPPSPAPQLTKAMALGCKPVACDATHRYRQPLAFGVHQVAPEGRVLGAEEIQMSLYRQNDGLSEEGLMRHVSLEYVVCGF